MAQHYQVAVLGATGRVGSSVINALVRHGISPIAIGREDTSLRAMNFDEPVTLRISQIEARSLRQSFKGAQLVINCAGPFIDTSHIVVAAALEAGLHYVDVSAEQLRTEAIWQKFHEAALGARLAIVQGMGLIGGLPDLMASVLMDGWTNADSIEIFSDFDSFGPTEGVLKTFARKAIGDTIFRDGRLVLMRQPEEKMWNQPGGLSEQRMYGVPFAETILISNHLKVNEISNYITQRAFDEAVELSWGRISKGITTPCAQNFLVEAVVKRSQQERRLVVRGDDSVSFVAELAVAAATNLMTGTFRVPGVRAPGDIFDAKKMLLALEPACCRVQSTAIEERQSLGVSSSPGG